MLLWSALFLLLGYFLYYIVLQFIAVWGHFELVEWLMVAAIPLILLLMVFCVLRAIKGYRINKVRQEEQMKKYQEAMAQRKQRLFMEDDSNTSSSPEETAPDDDDDWEPGEDLEFEEDLEPEGDLEPEEELEPEENTDDQA